MEFLAPVSLSVGIFSIVLALVAIWLSVTYSRDAAKALSETRELMRGVGTRVEGIERYTRDQMDKMLTHIMDLSSKKTSTNDMTQIVDVLSRIEGTPLEGMFMKYLERELRRREKGN